MSAVAFTHNEAWFRALIEQSIDAIALMTPEGIITYASPSTERLIGYTLDEFVGTNALTLVFPEDLERILPELTRLLERPGDSISLEYRLRHKDGSWRWMEAIATNQLQNPMIRAFVGNYRDITDRKKAEEQLRESEKRARESERKYLSLVESDIFGVIVTDAYGQIYEANDHFVHMLGYGREELLSGNVGWWQLTAPEYQKEQEGLVTTFAITGVVHPWEKEYIRKDGSRLPVLVAGALIDQENERAVMVVLDISDRKAAERRKQEFLSMVSHELRTPLQGILGALELARMHVDRLPRSLTPEIEDLASKLDVVLQRANLQLGIEKRLVEALLDVSRMEQHVFELALTTCNLIDIVQEVVSAQQRVGVQPPLRLILPPQEQILITADSDRIGQVLINYLTNAFKYAPINQEVVVGVEMEGANVRVLVRDQGPGLTALQRQQVWERFYRAGTSVNRRTEPGGLGLGLYIAKLIVEQHRGQVGVESTPGEGSTFWFTLPVSDRPEMHAP
ncbi:MAG: PAS domain S-box protein [Chloroflexi bacterium]|nr:PAS domain S-box protein [Chloroflexota bacterium]